MILSRMITLGRLQPRTFKLSLVFSLLLACLLTGSCIVAPSVAAEPARFAITAKGDGNELTVSTEGETAIIDVQSASGIGSAKVELPAEHGLNQIVLRLHLQGLEDLKLIYGVATITAQVSSQSLAVASQNPSQHVSTACGIEEDLTPTSAYWLDLQMVSAQQPAQIPLKDGYFEFALPKDFWATPNHSFTVQWVDFYR
ncbi:MAG: hypothetical protein R3C14_34785 [Caldilineaceae bacterium]